MKLIALTGSKYSGKSTAASLIAEHMANTHRIHRLSFAEPLKEICGILFGKELSAAASRGKEATCPNWSKKLGEAYSSPRRIWQTISTEVFRRSVHPDFWVMVMDNRIEELRRTFNINYKPLCVIIDDCRFDNEAKWIVDNGGKLIEITGAQRHMDTHASEQGVSSLYIYKKVTNPFDNSYKAMLVEAINEPS